MRIPAVVPALAASAAVVLGASAIGQARAAVQSALPGQYRAIVAVAVVLAVAGASAAAVARIRDRRPLRFGLIAAALSIAAAYALAIRTGNADQDLVEQFHFVKYGLITWLFHRVWRGRDDGLSLALPLCAGTIAGVADEAFQWFVPTRVGELHDVLINMVASISGVLFSAGLHPPRTFRAVADARGRWLLAVGTSAALLAVTAFVDVVHLGHEVRADGALFRSTFAAAGLVAAAERRARDWRVAAPVIEAGIAREDHYLSEGQWHVQRRNDAVRDGDAWSAWNENRILESYFAPVLALGAAWPPEQHDAMRPGAATAPDPYVSDAHPYPIYNVDRWLVRGAAAVAVGVMMLLAARRTAHRPRPAAV